MKIGESDGFWYGNHGEGGRFNQTTHIGKVDLCHACNAEVDREREDYKKLLLTAVIVAAVGVGLLSIVSWIANLLNGNPP